MICWNILFPNGIGFEGPQLYDLSSIEIRASPYFYEAEWLGFELFIMDCRTSQDSTSSLWAIRKDADSLAETSSSQEKRDLEQKWDGQKEMEKVNVWGLEPKQVL